MVVISEILMRLVILKIYIRNLPYIAIETYHTVTAKYDGTEKKPDFYERKTCSALVDMEECFYKLEKYCYRTQNSGYYQYKWESLGNLREKARAFENWDDKKCVSIFGNTPSGGSMYTYKLLSLISVSFLTKV